MPRSRPGAKQRLLWRERHLNVPGSLTDHRNLARTEPTLFHAVLLVKLVSFEVTIALARWSLSLLSVRHLYGLEFLDTRTDQQLTDIDVLRLAHHVKNCAGNILGLKNIGIRGI